MVWYRYMKRAFYVACWVVLFIPMAACWLAMENAGKEQDDPEW